MCLSFVIFVLLIYVVCYLLLQIGNMSCCSDIGDDSPVAMDTEESGAGPGQGPVALEQGDLMSGKDGRALDGERMEETGRVMVKLPEEVLEYILSFLSPYQEHKMAALVCKQWYRLIKGNC